MAKRITFVFTAICSVLAASGAAFAADMVVKAPPPAPAPPPLPSWTGFYIGGNLGAGSGDKWWTAGNGNGSCLTFFTNAYGCPGSSLGNTSMDGFLGGFQAGYNWQTGPWVFGVEGTWDWTDMHGQFPFSSSSALFGGGATASSNIDWIATAAGRVGVSIDRALVYAGGGAAWAHEKDSVTFAAPAIAAASNLNPGSETAFGWTFLTGVEYQIDPAWSARIQYNFYDFGSSDIKLSRANPALPAFTPAGLPADISKQLRIQAITAGVNYRFWGSPSAPDVALPAKALVAAPSTAPIWAGFYVGGNLGAGFGDKWWTAGNGNGACLISNISFFYGCPGQSLGTTSMDGFLGGLQAGYNWQIDRWVFGFEGTWDWTDMHGQFPFRSPEGNGEGATGFSKIDWIATAVGRVGVTIDRALVYAGGGAAWSHQKDSVTFGLPLLAGLANTNEGSDTGFGWTFLTGVEYKFDPAWSARIQYNFYDFGSKDINLIPANPAAVGGPGDISRQSRIQAITAGVNYWFDKAPIPAPPPSTTWAGLYIGGNLGAGFGDKWWTAGNGNGGCVAGLQLSDLYGCAGVSVGTTSLDGFLGGLQAGYNWQTGRWVFGVEGTWDWTDMHGHFPFNSEEGNSVHEATGFSNLDWIATAIGRVGVGIDRALLYAGGGGAWAHERDSVTFANPVAAAIANTNEGNNTAFGWTFLAGMEYKIDPAWSARIQYNFYDFGSTDLKLIPAIPADAGGSPADILTQLRIHSVTAGVNYRFWGQ